MLQVMATVIGALGFPVADDKMLMSVAKDITQQWYSEVGMGVESYMRAWNTASTAKTKGSHQRDYVADSTCHFAASLAACVSHIAVFAVNVCVWE